MIKVRRPDIVVVDKKEQKGTIIDIAVPDDVKVGEKESEKVENYQKFKREISSLWKLQHVKVVPVAIGTLGSAIKDLEKWIKKLGSAYNIGVMQKAALLGKCKNVAASARTLDKMNALLAYGNLL